MPRRILRWTAVLVTLAALPLGAQQQTRGGTITGLVRDSASRPVAGADVVARPGDHRTRTDSAGRFAIDGLDPDNYTVRARKIGFRPDAWDVKLGKAGRVDIQLGLIPAPTMLDTLKISADRECPARTFQSFICHRQRGGGRFLDYEEIDDKETSFVGELFKDIPGFRVDFTIDKNGPNYRVKTDRSWGCIYYLVDGKPISILNPMPELSANLIGVEIYQQPDSVPAELQRYTWPKGDLSRNGKCVLIILWVDVPPRPR